MTSLDQQQWKQAIQEEYGALLRNNTWTITTLPSGRSSINSRWILKIKPGVWGADPRYKEKLVAKGYSQRFGID